MLSTFYIHPGETAYWWQRHTAEVPNKLLELLPEERTAPEAAPRLLCLVVAQNICLLQQRKPKVEEVSLKFGT